MTEEIPNKITPHLTVEEVPRELSAEDFQRELYAWFEERGLLCDLRAHLRTQMIHVLKDTAIGRSVTGQVRQSASPKLQALNLLLAEFLHSQDCYYTLSVFITEVPSLNALPDVFSAPMGGSLLTVKNVKKWKFKEKDMWDILETLGIFRQNQMGQTVARAYLDNASLDSLLVCITRNWHAFPGKDREEVRVKEEKKQEAGIPAEDDAEMANWAEHITQLLRNRQMDDSSIFHIIAALKRELQIERNKIRTDIKQDYINIRTQLRGESLVMEEKYKIKMAEMENLLKQQEEQLKGMQSHKYPVNDRLNDIYQEISFRERSIVERESSIKTREANLMHQMQEIAAQKNDLLELQKRIEIQLSRNTRNDDQFLQQIQKECKEMKDQIVETQDAILNVTRTISSRELQIAGDRNEKESQETINDLFRKLQKDNTSLQDINVKQHARIHLLAERAKYFMHELEKKENVYATPIVLTGPAEVQLQVQSNSGTNTIGGGEEAIGVQFVHSRRQRHQSVDRERPARRENEGNNPSSSSEEDSMKDIMKETRRRLSKLEEESRRINEDYQKFKEEQIVGKTTSSQPLLGSTLNFQYFKGAMVETASGPNYLPQDSVHVQVPDKCNSKEEDHAYQLYKGTANTTNNGRPGHRNKTSVSGKCEVCPEANNYSEDENQSGHSPTSSGILKALYEGNVSGLSFSSFDPSDSNQL